MRSFLLLVVGLVVGAAVVFIASRVVATGARSGVGLTSPSPSWTEPAPAVRVTPSEVDGVRATTAAAAMSYPVVGSRTYDVVPGLSTVIGTTGPLMRFQVSVEREITNFDAAAFAAFVESTYADPRGWASGGSWRMQRVGAGQPHDFVVVLVTPGTREVLCGDAGHDRFTNCRNGDQVVINADRWQQGVPDYGASLTDYRQYAINHETGHRLGDGHELCPGPGQPAPVMQQQTLGLHGCVANAWPYLNGKRYRGQSGAYNDAVP